MVMLLCAWVSEEFTIPSYTSIFFVIVITSKQTWQYVILLHNISKKLDVRFSPCLEITCPELEALANGQIAYSSQSKNGTYEIGTQALFVCDNGFTLVGTSERVCFIDDQLDTIGNWTSVTPFFQGVYM